MAPADLQARGLDAVAVQAALRRLRSNAAASWLHGEVAQRMGDKLSLIKLQPEQVIDWWSTLGGGAEVLAAAYPKAHALQVEPDASWASQAKARQLKPWWKPARWMPASQAVAIESDDLPAGGAGLVWANMVLHAIVDPVALIERWHRLLKVDGFVMFSCLGPGTLIELRSLYAELGWPTPTPGFIDMHDLGDMLLAAGFADPVMDQETLTLRWPSANALLAELRTLGGNAAPSRWPALRTPRWRDRLIHALNQMALSDGQIGLSFEVAYGHAFKIAPRPRLGETTTVSLEDMRAMVRGEGGRSLR